MASATLVSFCVLVSTVCVVVGKEAVAMTSSGTLHKHHDVPGVAVPSSLAGEDGEASDPGTAGVDENRKAGALGGHGDERSEEASTEASSEEGEQVDSAFHQFMTQHGREYQHGTTEYSKRKALFQQRLAAVHAHNAKPIRLWSAAPSKFSDHTEAERKTVRGYKRNARSEHSSSLLQVSSPPAVQKPLPESKSWMNLKVANDIKDQGSCGSCWAITTTSVLEAHYEIYTGKDGQTRSFSPQQTLECTPNPRKCGGTGGCEGATVELGMGYILKNGIATEDEVPYKGADDTCSAGKAGGGAAATPSDDSMQVLTRQREPEPAAPSNAGGMAFGLVSYNTLKVNDDYELAAALATYGPVAVSASAGDWFEYESGIFDGCQADTIVDHAITAYGYGKDTAPPGFATPTAKYWLIRNSWGASWGEKGFIRVLRHDDGKTHCGTDDDPSQGLGCEGGPKSVTICGMCGILFDSVVPYFAGSKGHTANGTAKAATTDTHIKTAKTAQPAPVQQFDTEEFGDRFDAPDAPALMRAEAKRH